LARWARALASALPDRVSPRALVIAVLVLLAVLAARVESAPLAVPIGAPGEPGTEGACERDALGGDDGELDERGDADRLVAPGAVLEVAHVAIEVGDVAAAAVRAAGLSDDPAPGWRTRARLAGLVPWISSRAGRDLTWREVDDPTLGHTTMFDVRATWHLDRLLFDPNEIRIAAMDVSRRRERRRVAQLAIHTFYAWLGAARAPARRWRADELRAELDAMTDGWFSQTLAKVQKP
jgi:hypothetical protein